MRASGLLRWFRLHARELPWRLPRRDPYQVVVSEFMLQQTQVDRVVPRFSSFVARFPTFEALAAACEDEVLEAWSGLGYYRRARMLHRLAREVVSAGGSLPRAREDLERLPGIGPYTAAAVASLAFGEAAPVLDGNTMRVGARVLALEADPRTRRGRESVGAWIEGLMHGAPPGEVNEALMELGAGVCTPQSPDCGSCPLSSGCGAFAEGRPEAYPPPRRRRAAVDLMWVAACAVGPDGRWLLQRVDDGPILRGLWLPALAELERGADPGGRALKLLRRYAPGPPRVAPAVRHSITHRRISVVPVRVEVEPSSALSASWRWVDPAQPGVPTSSLLAKLLAAVDALTSGA